MAYDAVLARELKGIFLSNSEIDQLVDAYLNGDLTEIGRILATYINHELAQRSIRVSLTPKGVDAVNAARLQGGVL